MPACEKPGDHRGRPTLAAEHRRTCTIGVRVSAAEYETLKRKAARAGCSPSALLRLAALEAAPRTVPIVNRDQWVELARTTSHFNQLVRQFVRGVYSGPVAAIPAELPDLLRALRSELFATKQALLGKRPDGRDLPSLNKTLNEAPVA
jgi:hypothetical protein